MGDGRGGQAEGVVELLLEGVAEPFGGVVEDFAEEAVRRFVEHEDRAFPPGDALLVFDGVDATSKTEAGVGVVVLD